VEGEAEEDSIMVAELDSTKTRFEF
jgi:hypothetical protein